MPFLTNAPLPQCLQHSSATRRLLARDHDRGCMRHLLKVKCLSPPNPPGFTFRSHLGGHGQVIVGEDPVYLSHLGVFWFHPERHPHNFQVILEASFRGKNNPQAAYLEDRRKHKEQRLYTLQPSEAFVITDLISTDPARPLLRSLKGD